MSLEFITLSEESDGIRIRAKDGDRAISFEFEALRAPRSNGKVSLPHVRSACKRAYRRCGNEGGAQRITVLAKDF
jgi:hypothetical protein